VTSTAVFVVRGARWFRVACSHPGERQCASYVGSANRRLAAGHHASQHEKLMSRCAPVRPRLRRACDLTKL